MAENDVCVGQVVCIGGQLKEVGVAMGTGFMDRYALVHKGAFQDKDLGLMGPMIAFDGLDSRIASKGDLGLVYFVTDFYALTSPQISNLLAGETHKLLLELSFTATEDISLARDDMGGGEGTDPNVFS